jgi:hypothetical protein
MGRIVLLGALALSVLAPAAADARPMKALHWKRLATTSGALVGDGTTVAWQRSSTEVSVKRAGHRPTTVRKPADCAGDLRAVGAGYLLIECAPLAPEILRFVVMKIADRTTSEVRLAWGNLDSKPLLDAVGAQWIAGPTPLKTAHDTTLFLNWHTSTLSNDDTDSSLARQYLDLSDPDLVHPLCSPVRRTRYPASSGSAPTWLPLDVSGRWTLERAATPGDQFAIQRCGTKKRRVLTGSSPLLGPTVVTWTQPSKRSGMTAIRAIRMRDGRRFGGDLRSSAPVHTANAVYAAVPTKAGARQARIFEAPLK